MGGFLLKYHLLELLTAPIPLEGKGQFVLLSSKTCKYVGQGEPDGA